MYRSCDYFVESCVTPYVIVACLNHLTCTYNLGRDWEWESTSLKAPKDEFGRPFQLLAYTGTYTVHIVLKSLNPPAAAFSRSQN